MVKIMFLLKQKWIDASQQYDSHSEYWITHDQPLIFVFPTGIICDYVGIFICFWITSEFKSVNNNSDLTVLAVFLFHCCLHRNTAAQCHVGTLGLEGEAEEPSVLPGHGHQCHWQKEPPVVIPISREHSHQQSHQDPVVAVQPCCDGWPVWKEQLSSDLLPSACFAHTSPPSPPSWGSFLGMTWWNSPTKIWFLMLGWAPAPSAGVPSASCWEDLSAPARSDPCPVKAGSHNHRRFGLGRPLKTTLFQPYAMGHLTLNSGFSPTSNI